MKNLILSAACALALAGCAAPGGGTVDPRLAEARGLSTAWASLDAVAVTLDGLAVSKALHGPAALTAAKDLDLARLALVTADSAYRAGDVTTAQGKIAQATNLISSLLQIAQQNGGK